MSNKVVSAYKEVNDHIIDGDLTGTAEELLPYATKASVRAVRTGIIPY
ncbi:hypothetical protein [Bacillus sp. J14TS2]|nr:hypothetical protein [Bacillus sp. J14TS2]